MDLTVRNAGVHEMLHDDARTNPQGDLVSVVIPAFNEERFIGACLQSILDQGEDEVQVIVVDGASSDRTADVVQKFANRDPRVELVTNPSRTIPSSLNLGLARARGRWLVRVDAHSTISRGYISRAVGHLETGNWGGVGGRKDGVGTTPAGRAIAVAMASRFGVGNSTYHHGEEMREVDHVPFGAYPTSLVRELGGWDERFTGNEDFEFDYRLRSLGQRLLFDPELHIAWHCRQSVGELFRQYRRYGRAKAAVARSHPRSMRPRHLAPPGYVALLALGVALRRSRLTTLVVMPYVISIAVATARAARELDDVSEVPYLAATFPAMHLGWGYGFWQGCIDVLRDAWMGPDDVSQPRTATASRPRL